MNIKYTFTGIFGDYHSIKYRPELDGLRAIAVLSVLFFHAKLPYFSGGFLGVDIFFVLSGYLITKIIVKNIDNNSFSILDFYSRRARRILPALFLVVLFSIFFGYLWFLPGDFHSFAKNVFSVLFFYSNINFWLDDGYFSIANNIKPLLSTWSLSVEEQFYIVFPILLIFLNKLNKINFVIFLLFLLSFSLSIYASHNHPSANFYLSPTRAWELLLGSLVFVTESSVFVRNVERFSQSLSIIGITLIIFSMSYFDSSTLHPGALTFIPVIGSACVIWFANSKTLVGRILSSRALIFIGVISYGLYLWHWPIFAFYEYRFGGGDVFVYLLLICLSIILSYLSWNYIEKPFKENGSLGKFNSVSVLGLIALLILLVSYYIFSNEGMKERFTPYELNLIETSEYSPMREKCHAYDDVNTSVKSACEYFNNNVTWAVFGDSHAVELSYSLAKELKKDNQGVLHLSYSACPPTFKDDTNACGVWTTKAIDRILEKKSVKNIVLSYRLAAYLFGRHEDIYPDLPNKTLASDRDDIWHSYLNLINFFSNKKYNVFVVLQAPELENSVRKTIREKLSINNDLISVTNKWWSNRNKYVFDRLDDFPKNVHIINPADYFCNKDNCFSTKKNMSLYFDDDHMSIHGASIISKKILSLQ